MAVIFFSVVEVSQTLVGIGRIVFITKATTTNSITPILVPIIISSGIYIASRVQRALATVQRSTRQSRLAFQLFCLEYIFRALLLIIGFLVINTNSDFAELHKKEVDRNLEKLKSTSALKQLWWYLLFFSPVLVGWGLRRTLNELREEVRVRGQQLPQQAQTPEAQGMMEQREQEERQRQLFRVRTWPRVAVTFMASTMFFGNLYFITTMPSDTSDIRMNFFMDPTTPLPVGVVQVSFQDLVIDHVINLFFLWCAHLWVRDLEARDARVAAANAAYAAQEALLASAFEKAEEEKKRYYQVLGYGGPTEGAPISHPEHSSYSVPQTL
ncbi:hypothetical protein BGZ83_005553 [Gryganskiella cystojenkinii]|nr:hypothetical protein BGZ83_005553 [Gryganskiella cystojenkinii]